MHPFRSLPFLLALVPGALGAVILWRSTAAAPEPLVASALAGPADVRMMGRLRAKGMPVAGRVRAWRLAAPEGDATPVLLAALRGEGTPFYAAALEAGEAYDLAFGLGEPLLLEARSAAATLRILLRSEEPCRTLLDLDLAEEWAEVPLAVEGRDPDDDPLLVVPLVRAWHPPPFEAYVGEPVVLAEGKAAIRIPKGEDPEFSLFLVRGGVEALGEVDAQMEGERIDLDLRETVVDVSLRVVEAATGVPVPGARLEVRGPFVHVLATSDDEGRIEGRLLGAWAWGEASIEGRAWVHDLAAASRGVCHLQPVGRVEGVVRSLPEGRPVAEVAVWAQDGEGRTLAQVRTDAQGRFVLDRVPSGEVVLGVRGAAWVSAEVAAGLSVALPVVVVPPDGRVEVDLDAVACGRIQGRARTASGEPLADAYVRATCEVPGRVGSARYAASHGVTDAEGRFLLEGVEPGLRGRVVVSAWEGPDAISEPLQVAPGGELCLDLVQPRPRWFRVQVRHARTGTGVPGVRVDGCEEGGVWRPGTTDAEGWVRLGPFGRDLLEVSVGRHQRVVDLAELRGASAREEVEGAPFLLESEAPLRGEIAFPVGTGEPACHLVLRNASGSFAVDVDAEGRFEVPPLWRLTESVILDGTVVRDGRVYQGRTLAGPDGALPRLEVSEVAPAAGSGWYLVRVTDEEGRAVPTGRVVAEGEADG